MIVFFQDNDKTYILFRAALVLEPSVRIFQGQNRFFKDFWVSTYETFNTQKLAHFCINVQTIGLTIWWLGSDLNFR